jgi:hypothetical protein
MGDIANVLQSEVNPIKALLMQTCRDAKFTFIVVNKRINTRFFLKRGNQRDNPQTGTVVDDVVTLPNR